MTNDGERSELMTRTRSTEPMLSAVECTQDRLCELLT